MKFLWCFQLLLPIIFLCAGMTTAQRRRPDTSATAYRRRPDMSATVQKWRPDTSATAHRRRPDTSAATAQKWRPDTSEDKFCDKSEAPKIFGGGRGGRPPNPRQIVNRLHQGRFPGGFYGKHKW